MLAKYDIAVGFSRVILACCPEEIMRQALKANKKAISECDALIVLSCAAGIKSANACSPGLPVITVLDSVGSAAVACSDPVLARSLCTSCGHCVLSYTAGICPISECTSKCKYGPCKKFSESNTFCAIDPTRDCVWHIIRKKSDNYQHLSHLKGLHERNEARVTGRETIPRGARFWKKFFACFAARLQSLEWVIRVFRK
jgi:hypothetical protein